MKKKYHIIIIYQIKWLKMDLRFLIEKLIFKIGGRIKIILKI